MLTNTPIISRKSTKKANNLIPAWSNKREQVSNFSEYLSVYLKQLRVLSLQADSPPNYFFPFFEPINLLIKWHYSTHQFWFGPVCTPKGYSKCSFIVWVSKVIEKWWSLTFLFHCKLIKVPLSMTLVVFDFVVDCEKTRNGHIIEKWACNFGGKIQSECISISDSSTLPSPAVCRETAIWRFSLWGTGLLQTFTTNTNWILENYISECPWYDSTERTKVQSLLLAIICALHCPYSCLLGNWQ